MQKNNFFLFLLVSFLTSSIFLSCSKDDGGDGGGDLSSITVIINKTTFDYAEKGFISVKTSTGADVSTTAEIKLDDEVIGIQYKFLESGTHTLQASYDGIVSNEVTVVVNQPPTIELSVDRLSNLVGEEFQFSVKAIYPNGTFRDKTTSAVFSINDVEQEENTFTSNISGDFVVKAIFEGLESNELSLFVDDLGPRFQKHVLIEDFTGNRCQYCPRIAYAIEQTEATTDLSVPVAVHAGGYEYVMSNTYSEALLAYFPVSGFPSAFLDGTTEWNYPEPNNVSQVVNMANTPSRVGVSLEASLSGGEISLDINVKFGENYSEDVFLTVFVLEDGIIAEQYNGTSYYGGVHPLTNFEHNHVLRHSLTAVSGDLIPNTNSIKNTVYNKNYSFSIPANIADSTKMTFVAIVSKEDRTVINTRGVVINASNTIEEN